MNTEEDRQWIVDWRGGMFSSSSRDEAGWPIEMHGVVASWEKCLDALEALNALRSNVVGTQNAGWSNTIYPFVAILNEAGLEQFDPSEEQLGEHWRAYGGAGGYPGHPHSEPSTGWSPPVGLTKHLAHRVRLFLDDPTDENRAVVEAVLERVT